VRSKAPSNLDKDLVVKFDEKRRAKYHLIRELQLHDQGKFEHNFDFGVKRENNSFCITNLLTVIFCLNVDETGKYKTGKCSVEYFVQTANKYGIDLSEESVRAIREKALPGGMDVIQYVPVAKELSLKIIPSADDSSSQRGKL